METIFIDDVSNERLYHELVPVGLGKWHYDEGRYIEEEMDPQKVTKKWREVEEMKKLLRF